MKLRDKLEGNCNHGIPRRESHRCEQCWSNMMEENRKKTEKFLKDLDRATTIGRKSKLQFD